MTRPVPHDLAQHLLSCISHCMARHAVTALRPLTGQEALLLDDPVFGPSSNQLHLTWAHPDDQGTLLKLAGVGGPARLDEQAFYDDLTAALRPLGARGLRFTSGSVLEFRPVEGQPGRLAFLFHGVNMIPL